MKYRKKPVIIEAEPYRKGLEDGVKVTLTYSNNTHNTSTKVFMNNKNDYDILEHISNLKNIIIKEIKPFINTLEGKMFIDETDMIITGVKGERYPCKLDIFNMTYEKIEK